MLEFGSNPYASVPLSGKRRNAFKKVASLRLSRAPILWLVGPARYERVFLVDYGEGDSITFTPASHDTLLFKPSI